MAPRPLRSSLVFVLVLSACGGSASPAPSPWPPMSPPSAVPAEPASVSRVAPPPPAVVQAFGLSPRYVRYVDAGGMPILGTAKVHDEALLEAAHVVRAMLARRPELLGRLGQQRVRLVVMATTEMTTDVPEHADLTPRAYWDRRARGLGPTPARPAVSCAEENLLEIAGDPYSTENILVHEFGHAVMEMAMPSSDPSFVPRVRAAYDGARRSGLWRGTYAMENASEYWAELTQSWFDTNRSNDALHNDVDTREEVKKYDPAGARLLTEVYGDLPWRYQWPSRRPARERTHLAGLDRSTVTPFAFRDPAPVPLTPSAPVGVPSSPLAWLPPASVPARTPPGASGATWVTFVNRRATTIAIDWVDTNGGKRRYAELLPGRSYVQQTYVGHVWAISAGAPLGGVVAGPQPGTADVR